MLRKTLGPLPSVHIQIMQVCKFHCIIIMTVYNQNILCNTVARSEVATKASSKSLELLFIALLRLVFQLVIMLKIKMFQST